MPVKIWGLVGVICAAASAAPVQKLASDAGATYLQAVDDRDWGRPIVSGDLDGDGYDELIIAASESFGDVLSRVDVIRGGPDQQAAGITDLAAKPADQVILGAALNDNLGASMATGDVNGDGVDDLLLCASSADYPGYEGAGIAYLILGGPQFFDSPSRDLSVIQNWDLRIVGPVAGGDMGGANLFGGLDAAGAAIGNLDGDPYGDMVFGVHRATGSASTSGRVYILRGFAEVAGNYTILLNSSFPTITRINGVGTEDELGTVVLAGDLTGDGIDELIMPNEYFSHSGFFSSEGAVHILRGRASWPATINLSSTTDIRLLGAATWDTLGTAAVVGDFNDDGVTDLAVSASGADAGAHDTQQGDGFVYGLFGSSAYQTGTHVIDYATATPDFLIVGDFQKGLGDTMAAGDFDGDGVADVAAGQRFGGSSNGTIDVVFGGDLSGKPVYTANVDTDLRITGDQPSDRCAFWLASADVNHDGLHEIVFGSPFDSANDGVVWVYSHATGDVDHDADRDLYDYAQFQACAAGAAQSGCFVFDFNTDGVIDLLDLADFVADLTGPAS